MKSADDARHVRRSEPETAIVQTAGIHHAPARRQSTNQPGIDKLHLPIHPGRSKRAPPQTPSPPPALIYACTCRRASSARAVLR